MMFHRHKGLGVTILLLVVVFFANTSFSQSNDENHIKSSFILNFIEETNWNTKVDTFYVGVLGSSAIYEILNELSNDLKVKGRPFVVVDDLKSFVFSNLQVVYFTKEFINKIPTVRQNNRQVLTISEDVIKPSKAAIYFVKNEDGSIHYQLDLDEYKASNLSASAELLLYGGEKEEAFGKIKVAEEELKNKIKILNERDKVIQQKEQQIFELSKKMKILEQQVSRREQNILKLKLESELNEEKLEIAKIALDIIDDSYTNEKKLNIKAGKELENVEEQYRKKQDSLSSYQSLLNTKAKEIEANNLILNTQNIKIERQIEKLLDLDSELKQSRQIVLISTSVVIIIVIILFFLFRGNKIKNRNLAIIEEKNQRIVEASKHKDEFIANLTHEVRTPLNAITGYTNLLLSKSPKKENKSYLQKVLMSSNNLLVIISDILDLSKIEAGKIEFEAISFDFSSMVYNAFESMKIMAESRGLHYFIEFDESLPEYVKSDPTRINQVLLNLLSNAIKFTEKGFVSLTIKLKHVENEIAIILFTVKDSGKGIGKDKLKVIFESFIQEDVSTTRLYGGTGLGLTISRRIINLLGSDIAVESELDKGTTFSFELKLPLSDASNVLYNEVTQVVIEGIETKKIIVADDEKLNRELLKEQFVNWNPEIDIDVAKDGLELVAKVAENQYDVVLTDVRMPKLNGIDATRQIKNINPEIVIIGVSANAMDTDIRECLDAGMNDYVTKPVNFNDLLIAIAKHLYLPYHVASVQEVAESESYFYRMKMISSSNEEFLDSKSQLIQEIDSILNTPIKKLTYKEIHSLLNKVIYVNDFSLIESVRILETCVKSSSEEGMKNQLIVVQDYWAGLVKKL